MEMAILMKDRKKMRAAKRELRLSHTRENINVCDMFGAVFTDLAIPHFSSRLFALGLRLHPSSIPFLQSVVVSMCRPTLILSCLKFELAHLLLSPILSLIFIRC